MTYHPTRPVTTPTLRSLQADLNARFGYCRALVSREAGVLKIEGAASAAEFVAGWFAARRRLRP